MKQKLTENKHQYHFLCEKQLQFLKTKDNTDYLDSLASEQWYSLYAFNWVSQIQVFHKYIHNRVIYVTGSTGVGKSTQIPKLFLYALKMISYKHSGKVVCSEPRYDPTIKNATKIADEFGVPLSKNNYYIQIDLKDKSKQHKKLTNNLELKFITDGKLVQEVIKSPVLKTIKNNQFTSQNQYDIVIIDESHEHNRYIDLLLTLLRHSIYFNNDTILVIMSATMENDEPIYRKYYRNINDNLKYPIFKLLKENQYDRVHIDRRIHISPPGETTLNQITEYYVPNETIPSILKHILKTSQIGDILIFVPKVKELLEWVTEINSTIQDSHILAIPFHAKLKNREIITYLDDYRDRIHISKGDNFEDLTMETIRQSSKQNKYTRYIIVATSIAEASITLTHLKYVIDTGKHQTVSYDYKRMIDVQEVKPISNYSRIQRKGRVGRVSSGTVYYLYNKEHTLFEKPRYEIENDDITENLYSLCKFTDDNDPLFTSNNDPNLNDTINLSSYKYNLNEMIRQQYFTYNQFDVYRGKTGSDTQLDPPPYSYMTGYSSDTLFDQTGSFYIIHPEESTLKRSEHTHLLKEPYKGTKLTKVFHQLQLWGFTTKKNEKTVFGKYCLDLLYDDNNDSMLNVTDLIVFVCGYVLNCLHESILLRYALELNVDMNFTDSNSDLISIYRLVSSGRLDSEQMQSIEKKRESVQYSKPNQNSYEEHPIADSFPEFTTLSV
jgi:HrpA-like RNA helicase